MSGTALEWHVSFGVQHPREPHPTYSKADGNGYITILADNYDQARDFAYNLLGTKWALLYEPGSPMEARYWPLGEIERFDATAVHP